MKKDFILIMTFCIAVLSSCEKDDTATEPYFIKATKNGTEWKVQGGGALINNGEYIISASDYSEGIQMTFNETDKEQSGQVNDFSAKFFYLVGGDVMVGNYLLSNNTNSVVIKKMDPDKKVIEGTFSLSFEQDANNSSPTMEQTVEFKNGEFRLPYMIQWVNKKRQL